MSYIHREWIHVDDGTSCNFLSSTPTIPDTAGSMWCCQDHSRKIQAINWPLNLVLDQAALDAKHWEKQFRSMLQSYMEVSITADHFRAAICAFLGFSESPGDGELICQLNWITANQTRTLKNDR
jgi:hypothetical protein